MEKNGTQDEEKVMHVENPTLEPQPLRDPNDPLVSLSPSL
jgi:hypothetical protein